MSILIKGVEMSADGRLFAVIIDTASGTVAIPKDGFYEAVDGAEAVPVPPHGRLIDADALMEHCVDLPREVGYMPIVYKSYITNAPTVIEAEEDAQ